MLGSLLDVMQERSLRTRSAEEVAKGQLLVEESFAGRAFPTEAEVVPLHARREAGAKGHVAKASKRWRVEGMEEGTYEVEDTRWVFGSREEAARAMEDADGRAKGMVNVTRAVEALPGRGKKRVRSESDGFSMDPFHVGQRAVWHYAPLATRHTRACRFGVGVQMLAGRCVAEVRMTVQRPDHFVESEDAFFSLARLLREAEDRLVPPPPLPLSTQAQRWERAAERWKRLRGVARRVGKIAMFVRLVGEEARKETCSLCLDPLHEWEGGEDGVEDGVGVASARPPPPVRRMRCGHAFHSSCLDRMASTMRPLAWRYKSCRDTPYCFGCLHACPLCRRPSHFPIYHDPSDADFHRTVLYLQQRLRSSADPPPPSSFPPLFYDLSVRGLETVREAWEDLGRPEGEDFVAKVVAVMQE